MDLNVIAARLPDELLRLVASFCFRPVYKCDICKEIFGHINKYRYYSAALNLKGSKRCQPVPVLYLSWDAGFGHHDIIGRRIYCARCLTACGFQNIIDPVLELAFFTRQQVIVIQDFSSAFHDYHIMVCDWPKEDKPFSCVEQVMQTLKVKENGLFRGFCMYTARLNGSLIFATTYRNPDLEMITMFEKGFMHFYANEHGKFSDVFMNFRLLACKQKTFSFWIEAELVEQMQIQDFPSTQERLIKHFYLTSNHVENWMLERLRFILPDAGLADDPGPYRLDMDGELLHIPTSTIVSPAPAFVVPFTSDLFEFIRDIHEFHPNGDSTPYHFNTDLFALTESDSDSTGSEADTPPIRSFWETTAPWHE